MIGWLVIWHAVFRDRKWLELVMMDNFRFTLCVLTDVIDTLTFVRPYFDRCDCGWTVPIGNQF